VSSSASGTESVLRIGALRRPHGLLGEISVEPIGNFPELLAAGRRAVWERRGKRLSLEIISSRPAGKRMLLKFAGWEGIDRARELCGGFLCVPREEIAAPFSDFIFDHEVSEFECRTPAGAYLGRAEGFERAGSQCWLRVAAASGTVLVPFTAPIVRAVDREARKITLDPPSQLFET
jgi:16S rRNA processing protein RimM